MGERLLCKQEVIGSIPFSSTNIGGGLSKSAVIQSAQASHRAFLWSLIRPQQFGCSLTKRKK